jgi:hypothetical protein
VKFYVASEEGGLKPAGKDFLIAITLVVMLAQGAKTCKHSGHLSCLSAKITAITSLKQVLFISQ